VGCQQPAARKLLSCLAPRRKAAAQCAGQPADLWIEQTSMKINKPIRHPARRLSLLLLSVALAACQQSSHSGPTSQPAAAKQSQAASDAAALASLTLTNPSDFARPDSSITVSFSDLGLSQVPAALSVWHGARQIASQLIDSDGDGKLDSLFAVNDFAAAEQQQWQVKASAGSLVVSPRAYAEISHKVGGQWQGKVYQGGTFQNVQQLSPPPQYTDHSEFIRYEGPGIESDLVAYRIYLDWRNGFDIFGNVSGKPVLSQIGHDGYSAYHNMQPWGMDLLKVGKSLGSGGFGYWDGHAVQGVAQLKGHQATIHQAGPLYASLSIDYLDWQIAGRTLNAKALLSMQAGSRLLHNQISLTAPSQGEPLDNLVIGLGKLPGTQLIEGSLEISGHQYSYLASYGKQSLNNDLLGMAVFYKKADLKKRSSDEHSQVAVLELTGLPPKAPGQPNAARKVDYYLLAAWQGEPNGIKNQTDFEQYLRQQAEILDRPLRLKIDNQATRAAVQQPLTASRALYWSQQLADAGLKHQTPHYVWGGWDFERERATTFEYTTGLLLQAYDDLNRVQPQPAYQQAVQAMGESFVSPSGDIHSYQLEKFNIDSINSGKLLLRLYEQTGDARYQVAAGHLREQLRRHPKTSNGAFWHKKVYPNQVWLDGVYMALPFLAQYSQLFENGQSLSEVNHEFAVVQAKMREPVSGWYWHGWDESASQSWAQPQTGLSAQVWARGVGWLGMALVDTLEFMPKEQTQLRAPLEQMVQQLAVTLLASRDSKSGVWLQLPLQPGLAGNYAESSASSMFVYFLAKAQNLGLLEKRYQAATLDAYQALLNQFVLVDASGTAHLTQMVQVAGLGFGRDGSAAYYLNEPVIRDDAKGVGPFIMAGVQVAKLLGL